jgi:hypothetical protein
MKKIFASGKVKRPFLLKTGHTGIADRIDIIRKIVIDKKLHVISED